MSYGVVIKGGLSDFQIVQRNANGVGTISLYGKYFYEKKGFVFARVTREDNAEVVVDWTLAESDDNSNEWKISITVPQGGLYKIETGLADNVNPIDYDWLLCGDVINFVGVGDIFVIAGQSNSAGYGRGQIEDTPKMGIHIFKNSEKWSVAAHPLNQKTDSVHPENTESCVSGHSPYLHFAKILHKKLLVPIGLVAAAMGGSSMTAWTPSEKGKLYFGMLDRINKIGGKVKGVLWYQGCSDCYEVAAKTYYNKFNEMVTSLRDALCEKDLPFITVQLNRYCEVTTQDNDLGYSLIREVQRNIAHRISNVFILPALDLPLTDFIHNSPQGNMILAERMARCALANIYNMGDKFNPPSATSAVKNGDCICISFNNVSGNLSANLAPTEKLAFVVEESGIEEKIVSLHFEGAKAILKCEREIGKEATVSLFKGKNPLGSVPYDSKTKLPALAFYKLKVQ